MDLIMRREVLRMDLDLLAALSLSKALSTPGLTCILIECDPETNTLTLTASNGESTLTCNPSVGEVNEGGTVMVNAKQFASFVNAMKGDTIQLTTEVMTTESQFVPAMDQKPTRLGLESGKSRLHLPTMPVEQFPALPDTPPAQAKIQASALGSLISRTQFCILDQDHLGRVSVPAGAFLEIRENGSATMITTDGDRLSQAKTWSVAEATPVVASVVVPRGGLEAVVKLAAAAGGIAEIAIGKNHIFFTFGKRYLVVRQMAVPFPNVAPIFESIGKGNRVAAFNASAMQQMLQIALLAVGRNSKTNTAGVNLDFDSQGVCRLNAVHSLGLFGEAEDEIPISLQGDSMGVRLNAEFLLGFLGSVGAERLAMIATDGLHPLLFRGRGADWETCFVLMPINPALIQAPVSAPVKEKKGRAKAKEEKPVAISDPVYIEEEAPF